MSFNEPCKPTHFSATGVRFTSLKNCLMCATARSVAELFAKMNHYGKKHPMASITPVVQGREKHSFLFSR
jgi:hypothetical protein